jgi:hypothetical protein
MDDTSGSSWPTEESSPSDGHRPWSPPIGASPSAESPAERVARLLAYGFPH